jgi:hypothetical protein
LPVLCNSENYNNSKSNIPEFETPGCRKTQKRPVRACLALAGASWGLAHSARAIAPDRSEKLF